MCPCHQYLIKQSIKELQPGLNERSKRNLEVPWKFVLERVRDKTHKWEGAMS